MQFTIASVIIENFRTIKSIFINFEGLGTGLHRLTGINEVQPRLSTNDVSKSTLWDAIIWCLYGKTSRNLNTNDIKPWRTGENPYVNVGVLIDGEKYSIERSPRAILLNGERVDQSKVEKLLRMGFHTFTYSIVIPQFQLMFFDLPPAKKLELFTEILDLERWEKRSAKARDRANELDRKVGERQAELIAINSEINQLSELVVSTRNQLKKWEDERTRQLEQADAELDKFKKELKDIEEKYEKAQLALDSAETELKPLNKEINEINNKINKIESAYQVEMAMNVRKIKGLKENLKLVTRGDDTKHCYACGQSLEGTDLEKFIKELKKEIKFYSNPKDWTKEKEATDVLKVTLNNLLKSKQEFEEKVEKAESRVAILAPRFGALQQKVFELQKIQNEKREITNPFSDTLSSLKSKKSLLCKNRDELEKKYKILNRKLERNRYWIRGFKDIRLQIVEEVLQELELTTNIMLTEFGLENWEVKYSIEQETKSGTVQRKLNVMILSPENDKLVKWECWGGGVSQRLRLVGALAFGETLLTHAGVQSSFLVADEPSRHMSQEGIEDMVELLANRAKELKKQIFLTDHTVLESSKFKSTITITKTKDGSYVS